MFENRIQEGCKLRDNEHLFNSKPVRCKIYQQ